MKRITSLQKKIAVAHLDAAMLDKFDHETYPTKENGFINTEIVKEELLAGKTYRAFFDNVEARYCSVGSSLLQRMFNHTSHNYKANFYKGFKVALSGISI